MPLYDYVCGACGRRVEVLHGVDGHGPERCEVCGGPMAKAFVPPTIHFRGSGWAKKDARASTSAPKRSGAHKPEAATKEGAAGPPAPTPEKPAPGTTDPA